MSKAVRIRDHLYAEIEALAKQERRSLIAQLEVLLEQALRMGDAEISIITQGDEVVGFALPTTQEQKQKNLKDLGRDSHFKPDFKKGKS